MTSPMRRTRSTAASTGVKPAVIGAVGAVVAAIVGAVGAVVASSNGKATHDTNTTGPRDVARPPAPRPDAPPRNPQVGAVARAMVVRLEARVNAWVGDGPQQFALQVTLEGRRTRDAEFQRLATESIQRDPRTVGEPLRLQLRAHDIGNYERFRIAVRVTCGTSLDAHEVQRNEFAAPDMHASERWVYDHPVQFGSNDGLYCGMPDGPVFFPFRIVANWT
ncbi:MAG: hypothetical protein L6Q99_21095 [Planctomycetes bacterium]|nr:hypothetical protein [Planctomycetota bacterium]